MAVAQTRIKSIGAAQSPLLGAAMFSPAILYILLLVAGPFFLAIFYAFSDARIGNTEMHFVGLENFSSILQSPSFRVAIRNSLIFTICSQIVVIVGANILAISLENTFRGRGIIRFLIPAPVGCTHRARRHRMEMDPRFDLQRNHVGTCVRTHLQAIQRSHVAWRTASRHHLRPVGS